MSEQEKKDIFLFCNTLNALADPNTGLRDVLLRAEGIIFKLMDEIEQLDRRV